MKHHVRKHHWTNGILHTMETFFDTLDEAMEHAKSSDAHTVKVYNASRELVHIQASTDIPDQISVRETYA
jgi:hypothetical protein